MIEDTENEEVDVEFSEVIEEKKMIVLGEGNGVDCDIGNVKSGIEEVGTNKVKSLIEVKSTYFVEEPESTEQTDINTENSKTTKLVDAEKIESGRKRRLSNTVLNSPKPNSCSEYDDSEDSIKGVDSDNNDDNASCKRQKMRPKVVNTELRRKIENNKKTNESSSDEEKRTNKEHETPTVENNQSEDKKGRVDYLW